MERLTKDHLDSSMLAIREACVDEPGMIDKIDPLYNKFRERFNTEAVGFCVEKYVVSELDFETAGDRGLGRMSGDIPRLGAYFRKQMSKLSEKELCDLYLVIQDLMLRGYLARALLLEGSPKQSRLTEGPELYEAWLPGFYSSDLSQMGPNLRTAIEVVTDSAFAKLTKFLEENGMRGGGFMSKDKTELICMYYPLAGFGIRAVETGAA